MFSGVPSYRRRTCFSPLGIHAQRDQDNVIAEVDAALTRRLPGASTSPPSFRNEALSAPNPSAHELKGLSGARPIFALVR